MDSLDPQLNELLEKYSPHFSLQENGKILCKINGHTLPPRFDEVNKFIQGPKFQKLFKRHQAEHALQKYEPFIVQSKNFPLMLYCALTGQLMDKSVEAVKKHLQGKKFQRAQERFTNDEVDLKPEPSLESFGVKLPKSEAAAAARDGDGLHDEKISSSSGKQPQQQQHGKAATNGKAAADEQGSEDEPSFWMPSEERASGSEQEGEDAPSSSNEQGDGVDMDAEAGLSSDPMDEDEAPPRQQQQQHRPAAASSEQQKAAATAAAAAAFSSKTSKQKQKQQRLESTSSRIRKKQNVNRPAAVKKAKR